jgi:hypothetical protein
VVIYEYAYHGVDFHDDPDMVLLEGKRLNDEFGKKDHLFNIFGIFYFLIFFVYNITNTCWGADCAPVRSMGMSPLIQQGEQLGVRTEHHGGEANVEVLEDLEEKLERLTVGILVPDMDDIPRRMQRNVVGVGNWFNHLL